MTSSKDTEHPLFQRIEGVRQRTGRVRDPIVTQAHGGGGKAMRDLIDDVICGALGMSAQQIQEDQARFSLAALAQYGDRLAFTTDAYVVSPLFFPGGDIGKLAVNGTINDLAVSGAIPLYLSCSLIIEEGLPMETLRAVLQSMGEAARAASVHFVTGDTKVVPRGAADQLFVTTTGIGVIPQGLEIAAHQLQPNDAILINGYLGDHGAAILVARGELQLETTIESDCAALHGLIAALHDAGITIRAMRDITRGGLSAVLNELAQASQVHIAVDGTKLPIRPEVQGFCEILGFDPIHLANEGKLALAVPSEQIEQALKVMHAHPLGQQAAHIATCRPTPAGLVTLDTGFGGERILEMLVGEQLPRIC
ncbi:MAG: hydrogenase expression/formation protein HypE [Myxococcales bacterium]|nr:hydrogenase expression/formation protein HypE [Myxococcales bacterium]